MSGSAEINRIDTLFDQLADYISPELALYMKKQFERRMPSLVGQAMNVELRIVVDASQVISELIGLVSKGQSALLSLAREPYLKLYGPPDLEKEIEEKIPAVAKKSKLDEDKLRQAWRFKLAPLIRTKRVADAVSWLRGYALVGRRDPKDTAYVALAVSFESHGILTKDSDIVEQGEVRTWRISGVRKFMTVVKKGAFLFYVSSAVLPQAARLLFRIAMSIVKSIFLLIKAFLRLLSRALSQLELGVRRLPDWAKLGLGVLAILALSSEEVRKQISEMVSSAVKAFSEFVVEIFDVCRKIAEVLSPFFAVASATVYVLLRGVGQAISEIRGLQSR